MAGLLLLGCVDTSTERVKLTSEVGSAALAVERNSLVARVSGSFTLILERGDLSESGATIHEAPALSLLVSATGASIMSLDAVPEPPPPWSVDPGQTRSVTFTLTDENTTEPNAQEMLCDASGLVVTGLLKPPGGDALTFESAPIAPTGCN
jgi:hypothetical protein